MVNKGYYQQRVHWWLIFRIIVGNKMTLLVLITHADLLIKGITGIKQIKGIADLGYIILKYLSILHLITITLEFLSLQSQLPLTSFAMYLIKKQ